MRFFKHGDSLAIVVPEPLRKSSRISENEDYEFFEVEPGVFILLSKARLAEKAKQDVFSQLCSRAFNASNSIQIEKSQAVRETPREEQSKVAIKQAVASKPVAVSSAFEPLRTKGFLVIENEAEAKTLSKSLESEIKAGVVRGVRGFDKRFYVISTAFLQQMSQKMGAAFSGKEPLSAAQLAQSLECDEIACTAVLQVLKEDGDVLEKKRGYFIAVK